MRIDLFDRYDIRARICALVFVVIPFLLDAYILVDAVRNISFTAIITAVLIASSGLFSCWIRYSGNGVRGGDYIAEFLLPESSAISVASRERYWKKLQDLEPSFSGLSSADAMKRKETAETVSPWLREKTRTGDFKLIQEENMNYGFIRNVFSVKSIFLWVFSIYSLLLIGVAIITNWDLSLKDYFTTIPAEHVVCGIIHITTYLIWCFGVTEKILDFSAKKYAIAVIRAIDKL